MKISNASWRPIESLAKTYKIEYYIVLCPCNTLLNHKLCVTFSENRKIIFCFENTSSKSRTDLKMYQRDCGLLEDFNLLWLVLRRGATILNSYFKFLLKLMVSLFQYLCVQYLSSSTHIHTWCYQYTTILILPLYFWGKSSTKALDCLLSALVSMGETSYNRNIKQNIYLTENKTDHERLQMKYVGT